MDAYTLLESLWRFFEQGGPVTWAILGASTLMWTLILERYWFYLIRLSAERHRAEILWHEFDHAPSILKRRGRDILIAAHGLQIRRYLPSIRTFTGVLPLLGLLGTVTGMIDTFDVMAVFGQGNARGMAGGISQALFTTLAGLLTALSGYYFSTNLDARARSEERHMRHLLK